MKTSLASARARTPAKDEGRGWISGRGRLLAPMLLFGLVLWAFLPAINNDFVGYDDPEYVTGNRHVQGGLSLGSLGWAFSSSAAANWHPVTWISHMLDCQLFGLAAWGHHFTSVLIHGLSTVVLFTVLRRMTGSTWCSFMVAAMFGVHPLRVESVVWVAERKDVLSLFFGLLSLGAYGRFAEESGAEGKTVFSVRYSVFKNRKAMVWYGMALGCFALGLMSKPMLVTLPFVMLLLDYWPLGRFHPPQVRADKAVRAPTGAGHRRHLSLVLEKVPFFVLALAACVVTYLVQRNAGAVVNNASLLARSENAVVSYCRYLGKIFWPVDLAPFYPPIHYPVAVVIGALLGTLTISALAFGQRERRPFLLVGWLWYLGTLVPVIGLVQAGEQSMADRYSYLPSIGILLMVVWGGTRVGRGRTKLWLSWIGPGAFVAVTAWFVLWVTPNQTRLWKDNETLFRHAILVTKNNYLAYNNLGSSLDKMGRFEEAKAEFERSIEAKPDYARAYDNLGVVLDEQGNGDEAIELYSRALELQPDYASAHNHLGLAISKKDRLDEAIGHYRQALKANPEFADAHYNLALALAHKGDLDEAAFEYRQTLRLQPGSADAHNNLGIIFDRKGQPELAIREYREALRLAPDYARARLNLGMELGKSGALDEAMTEVQEALRLQPDFVEAKASLEALVKMKAEGRGGLK